MLDWLQGRGPWAWRNLLRDLSLGEKLRVWSWRLESLKRRPGGCWYPSIPAPSRSLDHHPRAKEEGGPPANFQLHFALCYVVFQWQDPLRRVGARLAEVLKELFWVQVPTGNGMMPTDLSDLWDLWAVLEITSSFPSRIQPLGELPGKGSR